MITVFTFRRLILFVDFSHSNNFTTLALGYNKWPKNFQHGYIKNITFVIAQACNFFYTQVLQNTKNQLNFILVYKSVIS